MSASIFKKNRFFFFAISPSIKPWDKCIIFSLGILAPLETSPSMREQCATGHLSELTVFWSLVLHSVTMVCGKWFMVMQIQLSGKRVGTAPKTYGRKETDRPESGSLCWSSWKQTGKRDGLIERWGGGVWWSGGGRWGWFLVSWEQQHMYVSYCIYVYVYTWLEKPGRICFRVSDEMKKKRRPVGITWIFRKLTTTFRETGRLTARQECGFSNWDGSSEPVSSG